MLRLLLANGTEARNTELLNSRIQVANLIALISVVTVGTYTPLYLVIGQPAGVINNSLFCIFSACVFPLLKRGKYQFSFHMHVVAGYLYFIAGSVLFGIETNLHLFLIAMSMIVAVLFDSTKVIFGYTVFGIIALIGLIILSGFYEPLIALPGFAAEIQHWVSNINLVLLAAILFVFVLFFKTRLLSDQKELEKKKSEIEQKNDEITESLMYSRRIQKGLQSDDLTLENCFPGHVLFYRPKDIVSGDFYLALETGEYRFAIVADCTGHGVPGALMSVLGITFLKQIILTQKCYEPEEILVTLREEIIAGLGTDENKQPYKDGMDISVLRLHKTDGTFAVSAANNPVYHFKNNELTELAPSKQPVGFSYGPAPYLRHDGVFGPEDWFFLFTDGFPDQFGGPKGKKFMHKRFREVLSLIPAGENVNAETVFDEWKGSLEQTDDICVLGVRCNFQQKV